jgi:hypothetical protein
MRARTQGAKHHLSENADTGQRIRAPRRREIEMLTARATCRPLPDPSA